MDPQPIATFVIDIAERLLDAGEALAFVTDDAFGGQCMFVGRVRHTSHGRQCVAVHYDMFDPLALVTFREAAEAAIAKYGASMKVYVAHAKRKLAVGDLAVVIAAASSHRDEAFRACRDEIEQVKHKAPIWKQEHFTDGSSEWSDGCSLCPSATGEHGHQRTSG